MQRGLRRAKWLWHGHESHVRVSRLWSVERRAASWLDVYFEFSIQLNLISISFFFFRLDFYFLFCFVRVLLASRDRDSQFPVVHQNEKKKKQTNKIKPLWFLTDVCNIISMDQQSQITFIYVGLNSKLQTASRGNQCILMHKSLCPKACNMSIFHFSDPK